MAQFRIPTLDPHNSSLITDIKALIAAYLDVSEGVSLAHTAYLTIEPKVHPDIKKNVRAFFVNEVLLRGIGGCDNKRAAENWLNAAGDRAGFNMVYALVSKPVGVAPTVRRPSSLPPSSIRHETPTPPSTTRTPHRPKPRLMTRLEQEAAHRRAQRDEVTHDLIGDVLGGNGQMLNTAHVLFRRINEAAGRNPLLHTLRNEIVACHRDNGIPLQLAEDTADEWLSGRKASAHRDARRRAKSDSRPDAT